MVRLEELIMPLFASNPLKGDCGCFARPVRVDVLVVIQDEQLLVEPSVEPTTV